MIREDNLSELFADVIKRIHISAEVADWITEALRESQDDKQKFHRAAVMRLQQQYLAVQAKIDRAYEDRLAGRVSDDLWERKTKQWEQELADIRRDTALHESASHDYAAKGSKILELAQTAAAQFVSQNSAEQARMLKMLLSNCAFDRGSLSVAWVKPFDLLARGNENGDWLGVRDDFDTTSSMRPEGVVGLHASLNAVAEPGSFAIPRAGRPLIVVASRCTLARARREG